MVSTTTMQKSPAPKAILKAAFTSKTGAAFTQKLPQPCVTPFYTQTKKHIETQIIGMAANKPNQPKKTY
ncbi:MAG: hypothetical protein EAY75_03590 [Bacteroidetes bacterium]|nr:MAG: hypothetical protein EAY75_03590 [Bacteroidota bacterium]